MMQILHNKTYNEIIRVQDNVQRVQRNVCDNWRNIFFSSNFLCRSTNSKLTHDDRTCEEGVEA